MLGNVRELCRSSCVAAAVALDKDPATVLEASLREPRQRGNLLEFALQVEFVVLTGLASSLFAIFPGVKEDELEARRGV